MPSERAKWHKKQTGHTHFSQTVIIIPDGAVSKRFSNEIERTRLSNDKFLVQLCKECGSRIHQFGR
jgi:predicted nucleic-acid-binding Zn-ribbon protein